MVRPLGQSDARRVVHSSAPTSPRRARSSLAAALTVVLLLGASACGSDSESKGSSTTSTASSGPLSTKELVAKVRQATVSIVQQPRGEKMSPAEGGEHAHGSGVIYDAQDGLVLTSNHVVEHGAIHATLADKTELDADLVARLQCSDLAVVKLHDASGLHELSLSSTSPENGGEVTAIGWLKPPEAKSPSLKSVTETVSAVNVAKEIAHVPFPSLVELQGPDLDSDMSGGAVVDDRARLVGLATVVPGVSSDLNKAVSGDYIRRRLNPDLAGGLKRTEEGKYEGWASDHSRCHHHMQDLAAEALVTHGGSGHDHMSKGSGHHH